ncbi:MAG: carotenoid oxygenase family protein [Geitlerinemataceae cyanobacterium]
MQVQSNSSPSETSYTRDDWQRGYLSQPNEYDYWIDEIDGEIPPELEGTLFRNGPGLLDVGGQPIHHPFDGDGMICSIAFAQGRAYFRNRFVETEGYLAEKKAGKLLYRGVFGTQKSGGWLANLFDLKLKNIANTNVIYWGGKLLALWEAALPHSLDPHTLETRGLENLDGVLKDDDGFSAHPRIDPNCQWDEGQPCLVNFALKSGVSSTITIYEFDPDGTLLRQHAHVIPGFAFIHDMAITPNYCIFFQNPVKFNPLPFLLGWRGAAECVQFDGSQPTKIILIPRSPQGGDVRVLETEPCFVFHHANAWEDGNRLYLDSICYNSFPTVEPQSDFRQLDFDTVPHGQLWHFEMDLSEKTVRHEEIEPRCCEFPVLNPHQVGRAHRYLYLGTAHEATGNHPLQGVLKIDRQTGERQIWSAAPQGFAGEPIFVPRPGSTEEDDGWVLLLSYDAASHRSNLVILDAGDLSGEPLARLHLKHHIPYGLHGSFTPEVFHPLA